MKRFKKYMTVDTLIMTLASVTLTISLYFLFNDGSFSETDYANIKPVGTFNVSSNDVRRRLDAGMTWSNVDAPDKVYEGDAIFTGDSSEAKVTLANGTIIKVAAKSMVVIRTQGGKTNLDLQYGSLHGTITNAKDSIVISQNGQSQELTGSSGSEINIVKAERGQAVSVRVTKGQVRVPSKGGKSAVMKEDDVVQLSETAQPKISRIAITLVSPIDGATKWVAPGSALALAWKSTTKDRLRVEFSRDREFEKPFFTADTTTDRFSVPAARLPEGSFFWRVKPAHGEPSSADQLTTFADLPPTPVLPKDEEVYLLEAAKHETAKMVFFTWEDKSSSVDYGFELARDKDFKSIVKTGSTKEKMVKIPDLPAADYFWRVAGRNPAREKPPFSRVMRFTVRQETRVPTAPILEAKELSYTIPESSLARLPASVTAPSVAPDRFAGFKWAPTENAKSYEVEVAVDPTFKNSTKVDNVASATFVPKEVRPGAVYMRVRAKNQDGAFGPLSEPAKLEVYLPPPNLSKVKAAAEVFKTQKEFNQANHEFRFTWNAQPYADSYEFQWGSDSSFANSSKFKTSDRQRSIKVTDSHDYAARVRSLDANGQPLGPFSMVEIASYKKELKIPEPVRVPATADEKLAGLVETLPIPQLKEPVSDIALISIEQAPTFVNFKWQAFKGASFYTIQVAKDPEFKNIVAESKATKNSFICEKALPNGKVFWRVRVHTQAGFSRWSDPYDINVIYQ